MMSGSSAAASPIDPLRIAIFGTHPKQFNGYSKVVYELCKALIKRQELGTSELAVDGPSPSAGAVRPLQLHVFGFQHFYNHPGHRTDLPPQLEVYDPASNENPRQAGFGVPQVKEYVERIKPHVCVVFNDLVVLTSVLNELKDAPNRADFKIIAYIDQVYLCQRRDLLEFVNQNADAAMIFTPEWLECIKWQGLRIPAYVLVHGMNTDTYFPVPKKVARAYFGFSEDDFIVLNLNRNQPRKRWDTCMQAFAEVVAKRPDAPIKMVIGTELKGAWDLIELYQRELKKRGVDVAKGLERLIIPGHAQMLTDEETNLLYNTADIGINTCDGEGFGLCNFEQAALGIPQVVPRLGGFLHFFDDSMASLIDPITSLYVDASRDSIGGEAQITPWAPYAEAIIKYHDNLPLRVKHGAAARKSILARFPWSTVATTFERIINKVVPPVAQTPAAVTPAAAAKIELKDDEVVDTVPASASFGDAARLLGDEPQMSPVQAVTAPTPEDAVTQKLTSAELDELRQLQARISQLLK